MKHRLFYKRKRKKSRYIFNQEDINKVVFSLPKMSAVIGEFIPLRKSGSDFVGRCPFCKEMTQNDRHFRVSDRKGVYKCFECGAGGAGSISFLMRWFDSSFGDVILFVNKKFLNLDIEPEETRRMKGLVDCS